jgi:putative heme iron utilization protein
MLNPFTSEISDRICKHMNDDHADAVLLYAKAFAETPEATAATMLKIDAEGMDLSVQEDSRSTLARVAFDHQLQDAEDAHQTLIVMIRQARQLALNGL